MTPLLAATLFACAPEPEPRTVFDFMEDGYAREGVLARCNRDRISSSSDRECANARRAAATIALEAERARAEVLKRESEAKLLALREREARRAAAEQEAAAAARLAAEAAYEARWSGPAVPRGGQEPISSPVFGTPVGPVMPSMDEVLAFDDLEESADPLGRPSFEIVVVEPPSNEVVITAPELDIPELAGIPRPFHAEAAN